MPKELGDRSFNPTKPLFPLLREGCRDPFECRHEVEAVGWRETAMREREREVFWTEEEDDDEDDDDDDDDEEEGLVGFEDSDVVGRRGEGERG